MSYIDVNGAFIQIKDTDRKIVPKDVKINNNQLKLEDEMKRCVYRIENIIGDGATNPLVADNIAAVNQFIRDTINPMMDLLPIISEIINNGEDVNNLDSDNVSLQDAAKYDIIENQELLGTSLQNTKTPEEFIDNNLNQFVGAVDTLRNTIANSNLSSTSGSTTNVLALFLKILHKLFNVATIYGIYIKESSEQIKQIQSELYDLSYITSRLAGLLLEYKVFLDNQEKKEYAAQMNSDGQGSKYQIHITPELDWTDQPPYTSYALKHQQGGDGITYASLYALNKTGYTQQNVNGKWETVITVDHNYCVLDVISSSNSTNYENNSFVKVDVYPGDKNKSTKVAMIDNVKFDAHLKSLINKVNSLLNENYSPDIFILYKQTSAVLSANKPTLDKLLALVKDNLDVQIKEMQKVGSFLDGLFNIIQKAINKNNGNNG